MSCKLSEFKLSQNGFTTTSVWNIETNTERKFCMCSHSNLKAFCVSYLGSIKIVTLNSSLPEWVSEGRSVMSDSLRPMEFSWPEYWSTFPFSRGSSQPRNWTQVCHIAGKFFASWATRKAQLKLSHLTPFFLLYLKISGKFQSVFFCF